MSKLKKLLMLSFRLLLAGLIGFATLTSSFVRAADFVVPALSGPVVDQVGLLSSRDKARLEERIRSIYQSGKIQPQILIVRSLGALPIEQASIQVVDAWKLGEATSDNGVLILMAIEERKVRIEVGQGLEGEIPDILASRVIRETMTPFFKNGDMAAGLEAGVYRLASIVGVGEGDESGFQAPPPKQIPEWKVFLMLLGLMLFGVLFSAFAHHHGLRGNGSSGFGGPFGGGGGFGGRGGGGWSGGGGGFSGGGASGGW